MHATWKALALTALIPFVLTACGGGGGGSGNSNNSSSNNSGSSNAQTGTLHVAMADSPSCGFDHVFITVLQVRVNASSDAGDNDAGWSTISLAVPQKIDLLSLTNGVLADLGQTALPAGQYQQVRLVLASNDANTLANSIVPTGGNEQPLDTPSATQSGYKIISPFTVQPNTLVDLVLDFNACKSIVSRGNGTYALKPVVTATPTVVSGSISGYVALAEAGATVYAEQNGKVVRGTVADGTGKFVLSPLVQSSTQGSYDVVIVQNNFSSGIVQSVPVVVNMDTPVSTSAAAIALPASLMGSVSGTVTPSAQALLRALQMINGATFEIAAVNANLDTGNYALSLPTGAPFIGIYSNMLPIALAQATSVAGQYVIEADASSGAVKSTNVDAATNPIGVDFDF
jgi:hypothetical protein